MKDSLLSNDGLRMRVGSFSQSSMGSSFLELTPAGGGGDEEQSGGNKLGTFSGVFVPCVLSIFGVILFERLGWIVGQAGLGQTLGMFALAYVVVVATVLSLSAIATNGTMKGGGAYYLISRALGPEFGGAIGLIFYAANVSGCAVYLLGFAEAVEVAFSVGEDRWVTFLVCFCSLLLLTAIVLVGSEMFAKTGILIFIILVVSIGTGLLSFVAQKSGTTKGFTGVSGDTLSDNMGAHYTSDYDFFSVFAILFPAVTGIMAGANMSGDLAKPGYAIPVGTLLALAVSVVVYGAFAFLCAATVENDFLTNEDTGYQIMQDVAFVSGLITMGIFAAVLSSAMGAIIGGAKILQALARDDIVPVLSFFKKGSAGKDEPRRGILLTSTLVTIILVATDDLNTMATLQTLFFLLSYALVNFACFALSVQGSLNFRPTFRYYTWHVALLGTVLCVGVMFATDVIYASVSIFLCVCLYAYVHFQAPPVEWGAVSQSLIYHQVRKYLLRLDPRKQHIKFWRPNLLVFVSNPRSNYRQIMFANNLKKGGLYVIGNVLHGSWRESGGCMAEAFGEARGGWVDLIRSRKIKAFTDVVMSPSFREAAAHLCMTSGLGALRPNSVMMGFYDPSQQPRESLPTLEYMSVKRKTRIGDVIEPFPPVRRGVPYLSLCEYVDTLVDITRFSKNLLVTRHLDNLPHYMMDGSKGDGRNVPTRSMYIDVWCLPLRADQVSNVRNMKLCMLLGYILRRSHSGKSKWRDRTKLRVNAIVDRFSEKEACQASLEALLVNCRIRVDQSKHTAGTRVFCLSEIPNLQDGNVGRIQVSSLSASSGMPRVVPDQHGGAVPIPTGQNHHTNDAASPDDQVGEGLSSSLASTDSLISLGKGDGRSPQSGGYQAPTPPGDRPFLPYKSGLSGDQKQQPKSASSEAPRASLLMGGGGSVGGGDAGNVGSIPEGLSPSERRLWLYNQVIRLHSQDTACLFLPMPDLPITQPRKLLKGQSEAWGNSLEEGDDRKSGVGTPLSPSSSSSGGGGGGFGSSGSHSSSTRLPGDTDQPVDPVYQPSLDAGVERQVRQSSETLIEGLGAEHRFAFSQGMFLAEDSASQRRRAEQWTRADRTHPHRQRYERFLYDMAMLTDNLAPVVVCNAVDDVISSEI